MAKLNALLLIITLTFACSESPKKKSKASHQGTTPKTEELSNAQSNDATANKTPIVDQNAPAKPETYAFPKSSDEQEKSEPNEQANKDKDKKKGAQNAANITKNIINVVTKIPVFGSMIETLDLNKIIDSSLAVHNGEDGSTEDLAFSILQSIISGLKLNPEWSGTVKTAEPLIMQSANVIVKVINGDFKKIFSLHGSSAEPQLFPGEKVILVLDNPSLSNSMYNSFQATDDSKLVGAKFITVSHYDDIALKSKLVDLMKFGINMSDIYVLYQDDDGFPTFKKI